MEKKVCTKCGEEKDINEFFKDKQKSSGYRPDCKVCNIKSSMHWARNNKDKRLDIVRKHNTGLSKTQYLEILDIQNSECAICKKKFPEEITKLCVDHCHDTMNIRGLLCVSCNLALGGFKDDVELLSNAIIYLTENQSLKNIKFKDVKIKNTSP